jgi:ribosomal protein S18 acetylase RimI-like enzyme
MQTARVAFGQDAPLHIEFRKAELPAEWRALVRVDHKIFPKADWFPPSYWKVCEAYWLLVDGVRGGCCAFDLRHDDDGPLKPGSLYIASTGILPAFQGIGLGRLMKAWQLCYAQRNGFTRIITTTRRKNARMIALNKAFGFRTVRKIPGYYADPPDAALIMELKLKRVPRLK